ncbi:Fc.00g056990.m01.CDS01 [Cosmosporella sp. VM-42]
MPSATCVEDRRPRWVKSVSEYAADDPDFVPGIRHGHWSSRDANPYFETLEKQADIFNRHLWGYGRNISLEEYKQGFVNLPPALVENGPTVGIDVEITQMHITCVPDSALVFRLHGGGWAVGDSSTEEAENRYLGTLRNVVLLSVHYRMAPEFPYPTPLNDCWDALEWAKANKRRLGIDPEKIILVGCSAGGNLAAALAIMARDSGMIGIVGQHLSIPVTCHPKFFPQVQSHGPVELLSWNQNKDAPLVDAVRMEAFWDFYVGSDPKADPLHSPLLSRNLTGLPPTMIHVAGRDLLRDEAIAYAEALRAAGVHTEMHIYRGLPHGFYTFMMLEETHLYFRRTVNFVVRCASGSLAPPI